MLEKVYEAVLFDMDGVVVDTEQTVVAFWQGLAGEHGFAISEEDLDDHVFGRPADHTLRVLFPMVWHTDHAPIYERLRINDRTLRYAEIPGAIRLVTELSAARVPTALVTGAQDWKVVAVLDQLGLAGSFDVQVRADDVPVGKPDPACYRVAAERLGVDIGRCLVFEDAFSGVTAAVAAGATCVALGPQRRVTRLAATGALTVVPDFRRSRYQPAQDQLRIDGRTTLPFARAGAGTLYPVEPVADRYQTHARRTDSAVRRRSILPGDADMFHLVNPPAAYDDIRLGAGTPREQVLLRSHLVGGDPALTRAGGGNFSAKGSIGDEPVLWMSSWGCDGADTTEDDFPALYMNQLLELRHRPPLDGRTMLDRIVAAAVTEHQKPPGIETLTHAFIPARHVDHCHPDAVIALTCIPGGRELAAAEFGEEAIWFDYRQFDMGVAQELADRVAARPHCRFILLANHGIFTWADTSEQCYQNSLEAARRAARALGASRSRRLADLGGPAVAVVGPERADAILADLLPAIRGALRDGGNGIILLTDTSPDAVRFVSSQRGPWLSQAGPGCPDSLVTAGYRPLALAATELTPDRVRAAIGRYRTRYSEMFCQHADADAHRLGPRRDLPRVLLLPGVGVVTSGADAVQAAICAEHFTQTRSVIQAADAAGGYQSLTEEQGIADEYWPLMRMKPLLRATPGHLADSVVLIAGGTAQAAARIANDLAMAGAHVMVAGTGAAQSCVDGAGHWVVALRTRTSHPGLVIQEAVRMFGGFDVVVDLTQDDELLGAASPVFVRQQSHGLVCLVGRSPADSHDGAHIDVIVENNPTLVAERITTARRPRDPAFAGS